MLDIDVEVVCFTVDDDDDDGLLDLWFYLQNSNN